jgi:molybdopterin-synthase adenylyltransferase
VEGSGKIRKARIFVTGIRRLSSPILTYLGVADALEIKIADFDTVDFSNLNRQFLHYEQDIGRDKVKSAKKKLMAMNPK